MFLTLLVGLSVVLGLLFHALNLVFGQTAGIFDGNLLFLAGLFVFGAHVQNAVGVDIEAHLNLRHAARSRLDAVQLEVAELLVVLRHGAFALGDLYIHSGLVVRGR